MSKEYDLKFAYKTTLSHIMEAQPTRSTYELPGSTMTSKYAEMELRASPSAEEVN